MGKTLIAACLLVAACQPMYGRKAERIRNPQETKPPEQKPGSDQAKVQYVEDCDVDFRAPPTSKRKKAVAEQALTQGDAHVANAKPEPTLTQKKITELTNAVQYYRDALVNDPYHAGATLKLALAYDEVLRKGCAVQMLRRLYQLTSNPAFDADAQAQIGLVVDNPHWFAGYRQTAMQAIGR